MSSETNFPSAATPRTPARLSAKAAVVTGALKGIGAAIAKELAAQGASVVVNYASSRMGAEKVVDDIVKAGGKAIAVGGNVADPSAIGRLFASTKEAYGRVDILVNNAGVYTFAPLEQITVEGIKSIYDVNIVGLLLATKAAVSLMPPTGGSIINISSMAAEMGPPTSAVYSSSKGAVNTITRVLAKELGPKKIRVNALSPGVIATEGYKAAGFAGSDFERQAIEHTPLGRVGRPEDIATVAAFLASDDARWVTGSLLDVAGGRR